MKRVLLILIAFVPMLAFAQQKCVYFEKMVKLETEKTDLNTTQSDFGPAFVQDELWYSAYTEDEIEKLTINSIL